MGDIDIELWAKEAPKVGFLSVAIIYVTGALLGAD